MRHVIIALLLSGVLAACATSPTGRSQLQFFSPDTLAEMGAKSYAKLRQEEPIDRNATDNRVVECVAQAITDEVGQRNWDVTVFQSDQVNAFALPGGKIGVYSGLLKVADTDDQLAAVLAHEVGHVIAGHGNERMSQQYATQGGLSLVSAFLGGSGGAGSQQIMSLLGVGAQVGILLPFSRTQESEADTIGLELMARAGFDPRDAVQLWRNMQAQGGEKPPALLSTHPSNDNRIRNLSSHMNAALQIYRRAPDHPNCG